MLVSGASCDVLRYSASFRLRVPAGDPKRNFHFPTNRIEFNSIQPKKMEMDSFFPLLKRAPNVLAGNGQMWKPLSKKPEP